MNKIILIGNGFDIAHGMKTSYHDFILWYFIKMYERIAESKRYEDNLVEAYTSEILNLKGIEKLSLETIIQNISSQRHIKINFKCRFFKDLLEHYNNKKWVDIESFYFKNLVSLYKEYIKEGELYEHESLRKVKGLNDCFSSLKESLYEYLNIVNGGHYLHIDTIYSHFANEIFHDVQEGEYVYFLIFNYTSMINVYLELFQDKPFIVNYIHGKLKSEKHPIIFGYGDEIDQHYKPMEDLNENEFLQNIKSFLYLSNSSYNDFSGFLKMDDYKVYILGHSCGLSDRVLLKSIFQNSRCASIKIFYHTRRAGNNNFRELTQNISRHFGPEARNEMRNKIVPENKSVPLS